MWAGRSIGSGFRRVCEFQIASQIGAALQIEHSQGAGQLVRGCVGRCALGCSKVFRDDGGGCGFKNGHALENLRPVAGPHLIQSLGNSYVYRVGGLVGAFHVGPVMANRGYFQPSAREICAGSVSGSNGLKSTASTPRSANRR